MVKKLAKILLWVFLSFAGLLVLISVLAYLPPVQGFIKDQASSFVSRTMGMRLDMERFRLKFPLRLTIDNTMLVTPARDTLVGFRQLEVDISPLPLLGGKIKAYRVSVSGATVDYRDTLSGIAVRGTLGSVAVRSVNLRLKDDSVHVAGISLGDAVVDMTLGDARKPADTTMTAPALWKIAAGKLDLKNIDFRLKLEVTGSELAASLGNADITDGFLDMGRQLVDAGLVRIADGNYSFAAVPPSELPSSAPAAATQQHEPAANLPAATRQPTPAAALPAATRQPAAVAEQTARPRQPIAEQPPAIPPPPAAPWQIRVRLAELENNSLTLSTAAGDPQPGFDPAHIEVSELDLTADTVYYRGSDISARLRNLALKERSGIEITGAHGGFLMDTSHMVLSGFELRTPNSTVAADLRAALSALRMDPAAAVTAKIDAAVGSQDIFLFYTPAAALRRALGGNSLEVHGDIEGEIDDLRIETLTAAIPGKLNFRADGRVASLLAPEKMTGDLNVDGTFTDIGFVREFLPDSVRSRVGFPDRMTLHGSVAVTGTVYAPDVTLTADGGTLAVKGRLDTRAQTYRAEAGARDFPLHAFLPTDSLGSVDFALTADGKGFDPRAEEAAADIELDVGRFDYMGYGYGGIGLDVSLLNHILTGNIHSDSAVLDLDLDITGKLYPDNFSAALLGRVVQADIQALNLSADPLAVRTAVIDASFEMTPDSLYRAGLAIDSALLTFGQYTERIPRTTATASSGNGGITASVRSGDLTLDFDSPVPLDSLTRAFAASADEIKQLVAERELKVTELQNAMPPFELDASAGTNNLLHTFMGARSVGFKRVDASVSTLDSRPLSADVLVDGLNTGSLVVDTLRAELSSRGDSLDYRLRLANRPGNIDEMTLIQVTGTVYGASATADFLQHNRTGRTGFRFGLEATLLDSAVRAHMTPDPLFGYRNWTVNSDNYVVYDLNEGLSADFRLDGDGKRFHVVSDALPGMPAGVVRLGIAGIGIGETLALLPSPPAVDGILSTDVRFGFGRGRLAVDGNAGIDSLSFDSKVMGDIGVNVSLQSDSTGQQLDGTILVNDSAAIAAKGTLASFGREGVDLAIDIPGVPLQIADVFAPEEMLRLSGSLRGAMTVKGDLAHMDIDGELYFADARAAVPMAGTTFGIAADHITINNSRVVFNDFGIIAPTNEKLSIDGTVDISDFGRPNADLEIFADRFRLVGSTWQQGSQIYGRAETDVDVTVKGYLDELQVRGDIGILNTTDVTYIMRDSPMEVDDREQDVVTFVSFADTARLAAMDSAALRREFGIDMSVSVDIADGVRATVNISEDGNNRIELIGEGTLSFTMSNQGDVRLAGRYDLTGGTVMYNPPIISQKIFAIQPDSYVSWTGDAADPEFNIKATQSLRTTVEMDNGTGSNSTSNVTFDVTINISNTLKNMAITFDLSAPDDRVIGPQLASLTAEQRSDQALALLIYNTYSGPGTTATVDANNPLNTFIERELNQWARNSLPGVDLSLGINNVDAADGSQHVGYSYSVSKSLFNDRVKVTVGGTLNSNEASAGNVNENIVQDFDLEYRLTDRDNMFLKLYRHNTQPSILEGEVTETGGGFVVRKKMSRLRDLFSFRRDPGRKELRRRQRELRRETREQEKSDDAAAEPPASPLAPTTPETPAAPETPAILNDDKQNDVQPLE